ncbi:hypothetical protein Smp_140020 [Schistosoma mansoni]|uniref:hypothetical protein n=1 Tax=Schistosoma mansoni TaxID=6183 RepID=UPI0001A63A4A|nr:hypothetical protein Smp_140020 [Schistosoma mansoni]|eukprot:XP_018653613.1 hypothetical protein Smp_140020 [Schistosoma mansoni]
MEGMVNEQMREYVDKNNNLKGAGHRFRKNRSYAFNLAIPSSLTPPREDCKDEFCWFTFMLAPEQPSGQDHLYPASKSRRWRVVFLGGEVKLASEYVDAEDGRPIWDCEVTLDLISPSDPITLLVIDGDNHNIGQVDIPLNQVPQTGNPNFDLSRLCYSDLKSKRKNSNAHGRLVYWIWAIDYWPPGTQANTTHHSKSLRGSLTHLGSKIRSKSKHRSKNDNDYTNGYQQSGINGSSSTLQVPGMSYNPFENDGTVSEFSGPMGLPPMYQSHSNSPYAQSEFGGSLAGSVKSTKQKNMLKKFKSKLSHSTLNLAEAAAKKAAGKDPYFQSLEKG